MKTAGQILASTRAAKNLGLSDITTATRIKSDYLQAIETDDYRQLPNSTVAKGFIKNYAQYLGLDWHRVLAVFRRDFVENPLGQIIPRGMVQPVTQKFVWTPKTTLFSAVIGLFLLFGGYLFYQFRLLSGPPRLSLDQPSQTQITSETNVVISGSTDPEATLSVNGESVILHKGGKFFFGFPLAPGENRITVTATSNSGKSTSLTRTVTLR